MADEDSERLDRHVEDLIRGRRPRIGPADAGDRRALIAAAVLAAARDGYPHPSAAFRRRLAARLADPGSGLMSRRTAMVAGLGIALGGAAGLAISKRLPEPAETAERSVEPEPGRWVPVASLADVPEGSATLVRAGAVEAFVWRSGSRVWALSAICSHMPCHLDAAAGGNLECPCHKQTFDSSGKPLDSAYAARVPPLQAVRTRVRDGRVEVLGT